MLYEREAEYLTYARVLTAQGRPGAALRLLARLLAFHKIIPMLTDPEKYGGKPEDSFDVIAPSIPGFGFSDRKAMSEEAVADLWVKLMQVERYL